MVTCSWRRSQCCLFARHLSKITCQSDSVGAHYAIYRVFVDGGCCRCYSSRLFSHVGYLSSGLPSHSVYSTSETLFLLQSYKILLLPELLMIFFVIPTQTRCLGFMNRPKAALICSDLSVVTNQIFIYEHAVNCNWWYLLYIVLLIADKIL